jgi:molybdate transport system substrate-binding protein
MDIKMLVGSIGARLTASVTVAAALLGGALPVHAAELRILSAAAMQSVFKEIGGAFERASGHRLIFHYGTIGAINQWVMGGEEADLVIGSTLSMPALVKEGKIEAASTVAICKVGAGLVVPAGDRKPPIASAEDLKRALLAAKFIVFADPVRGGAAGIHIAAVIQKLGITEQTKPKTKLGAGGDITEVTLALGNGTLGLTQISEIAQKPGAELIGPLPEEFQNYTTFMAGTPAGTKPSEAVKAFLGFLKSPTAMAVIEAKGMQVE